MHYCTNCHGTWQVPLLCHFYLSCLHVTSLCRLLTTTIIILSWNVASSSTMPLLFVMSACYFTMQTFNHNNYYICHGTWQVPLLCHFYLSCLHVTSLCRLLTTTIIILSMERGKFLYYATFICHVCMLLHYADF